MDLLDLTLDEAKTLATALNRYGRFCMETANWCAQKGSLSPNGKPVTAQDVELAIRVSNRAFALQARVTSLIPDESKA